MNHPRPRCQDPASAPRLVLTASARSIGALVLSFVAAATCCRGATPALEEIRGAWAAHRASVRSAVVDYKEESTALAPMEIVYKYARKTGTYGRTARSAFCGPMAAHWWTTEHKSFQKAMNALLAETPLPQPLNLGSIPYAQLAKHLDALPLEKVEISWVCDGKVVLETKADTYLNDDGSISPIYTLDLVPEGGRRFPPTYFHDIAFGMLPPGSSGTHPDDVRNHLPLVLTVEGVKVLPPQETVNGVQCVVIDVPGVNPHRLWLDPALAYVVRKREFYRAGQVYYTVLATEFVELVLGTWLPRVVTLETIGNGEIPQEYLGKVLFRTVATVTKLEANNDAHSSLFSLVPPAGAHVLDSTQQPVESAQLIAKAVPEPVAKAGPQALKRRPGPPPISYTQPANVDDLDRVVERAKERAAAAGDVPTDPGRWKVVLGVIAIAVCGAVLCGWRWRSRRSLASPTRQ